MYACLRVVGPAERGCRKVIGCGVELPLGQAEASGRSRMLVAGLPNALQNEKKGALEFKK